MSQSLTLVEFGNSLPGMEAQSPAATRCYLSNISFFGKALFYTLSESHGRHVGRPRCKILQSQILKEWVWSHWRTECLLVLQSPAFLSTHNNTVQLNKMARYELVKRSVALITLTNPPVNALRWVKTCLFLKQNAFI